jgi:putative FmdB family regulatory protein
MPVYVYRCENGHRFEATQRMNDTPLSTCTECEATAERVPVSFGIRFKGSGFHNTDYGTKRRPIRAGKASA